MLSKALAAVGLVAWIALPPASPSTAASTTSDPPPEKLGIELVTVNGSGCPKGTVGVAVSPDNTRFTVTYSDYYAQVGVGASAVDFRKNCQLNLMLHHPEEYRYAIVKTRAAGYALLQEGAYATVKSSFYFAGAPPTVPLAHRINGWLDDTWYFDDELDPTSLVWAPCGTESSFNVNTELRVYAGTSDPKTTTSYVSMDGLDIDGGGVYHLAWQRCPTR